MNAGAGQPAPAPTSLAPQPAPAHGLPQMQPGATMQAMASFQQAAAAAMQTAMQGMQGGFGESSCGKQPPDGLSRYYDGLCHAARSNPGGSRGSRTACELLPDESFRWNSHYVANPSCSWSSHSNDSHATGNSSSCSTGPSRSSRRAGGSGSCCPIGSGTRSSTTGACGCQCSTFHHSRLRTKCTELCVCCRVVLVCAVSTFECLLVLQWAGRLFLGRSRYSR